MAEDYSDSRMSMFHANEMHCICVHLFICLLAHRIVRRAVHSGQLAWQSSVADIVQGIECRRHRTVARSYARMSAHWSVKRHLHTYVYVFWNTIRVIFRHRDPKVAKFMHLMSVACCSDIVHVQIAALGNTDFQWSLSSRWCSECATVVDLQLCKLAVLYNQCDGDDKCFRVWLRD